MSRSRGLAGLAGSYSQVPPYYDLVHGSLGDRQDTDLQLTILGCPLCRKPVIQLRENEEAEPEWVWPRRPNTASLDSSIPQELQKEYLEAREVLGISANASAALSRRCLQTMLVRMGANPSKRLQLQIDEMLPDMPPHVQRYIHKVREIGNLAAHAREDIATAEIVDVDPSEAEWNLVIISELFDHYYVKPAIAHERELQLEAKLKTTKKLSTEG